LRTLRALAKRGWLIRCVRYSLKAGVALAAGQCAGRGISGRGRRARLAQIRWDTPWMVLIP
jgi:hypothetical protein